MVLAEDTSIIDGRLPEQPLLSHAIKNIQTGHALMDVTGKCYHCLQTVLSALRWISFLRTIWRGRAS